LDKLLVEVPQQQADCIRELFDELLSPRRRGRPSNDDELTIAREVAKARAGAITQGRRPNMKSIYGQVAKRNNRSPWTVRTIDLKYRDLTDFLDGVLPGDQ
jgi:hypothetical protein